MSRISGSSRVTFSLCRVTQNRSADTESAGSSYASGFIVDAQRGLILTNRHVVTPGACCFETAPSNDALPNLRLLHCSSQQVA